MKASYTSKLGEICISPEVIATYAGTAAVECSGIVGMAAVSLKDGFAGLLSNEKLTRGVNVSIEDGEISLDFHVIVAYSVNISSVAENLIETVSYRVSEFTGMKVKNVRVFVEGIRVID